MTEKIFLTKLKELSKDNEEFDIYYEGDTISIDGNSSDNVFTVSTNTLATNCASVEFHDFIFYDNYFKDPKEVFNLIMNFLIKEEKRPFIIFSDSKRNNVIYKYLDVFKNQPNFTIFEHKTNDKKSVIKTVIYCK
jgi:hypothetical protein